MRKILAAATLAAAAATLVPATSASAVCDPVLYALTGRCTNACAIAGGAVVTVQTTTGITVVPTEYLSCSA